MDDPSTLNERQALAAATLDGPLLVLAGAGTGKTRVIEARTAALLHRGVPPERILLLTFTRRAAQEMLRRTATRHPQAPKVDGGTFHALAFRLVARHHDALRLPAAPTVLDEDDAAAAVGVALERAGEAPKRTGKGRDGKPRLPKVRALVKLFSRATNLRRPLDQVLASDLPDFADQAERIGKVRRAYATYKLERAYVDFDDLLLMARILLADPERRAAIASAWSHVQVDEYQDVNTLQAELAEALAGPGGNLMVVGDPHQSIYAFRGALHDAIARFPERMPGAQVVRLVGNYRSSAQILTFVNAVRAPLDAQNDEPLRSEPNHQGEPPDLVTVADDHAAAVFVADALEDHLSDPLGLAPFAVLVRSRHHGLPLQAELLKRRIPFEVRGGLQVTELAHVRDVLAHLRLLHNPFDELAWMRVLMLLEGVGEVTAARIHRDASDRETLATTGQADPLVRARTRLDRYGGARAAPALQAFGAWLDAVAAADGLLAVFDATIRHYRPILKRIHDDHAARAEDLDAFRTVVAAAPSLGRLLADLALDPAPARKERRGPTEASDGVAPLVVSTVHSAKGLEWDHVYLLGIADGDLPSRHALRAAGLQQGDADGGDGPSDDAPAELDEERRLLYVAATRAKRSLTLVHAAYGRQWMRPLSRFLADEAVLATLRRAGPGAGLAGAAVATAWAQVDRSRLLDALAGEDLS